MIEDFYTQTFEVKRLTETKTGGRLVKEYNSTGSYKGAIEELSDTKVYTKGKDSFIITHRLYCKVSVDVQEGDKVVDEGNEFDVVQKIDPMRRQHHLEVELTYTT